MENLISTGITCARCGKEIFREEKSCTTGYGVLTVTNAAGETVEEKHCFACCAETDKQWMRDHGKITLYLSVTQNPLSERDRKWGYKTGTLTGKIFNWPGSLEFPCGAIHLGYHNWARRRYDTWFIFEGYKWHGVRYGDNTEILHCRKTKQQIK